MSHMANKLTLNVDGVELTKADLRELFDKYNALYFEGKLPGCKFFWLSSNHCAYGKYIGQPTKKGLISKIGVARNTNMDGGKPERTIGPRNDSYVYKNYRG